MSKLPIILIVVGIALLGFWGYQYSENNESAGIGGVEVSVSQSTSPVLGIAGGLALLAGIGMMARGKRI